MDRCITDLSAWEAKQFFMEGESYCSIDLPPYFNFDKFIKKAASIGDTSGRPFDYDDVCYTLMTNKDGKFAWRPLTLINPILYGRLVEIITQDECWNEIANYFAFTPCEHIKCCSLPIIPDQLQKRTAKSLTILNWCNAIEQQSIELALQSKCVLVTDITNCYGALYTHSISWALNGKDGAKENAKQHKFDTLGDKIDSAIRSMQYGQTNGIPQGSVLMDLIAEVVLHYIDIELERKIGGCIKHYCILRYRDDYKIFCNNHNDLEHITKLLSETLAECGLNLNTGKTFMSDDIIRSVIKPDKMYYISNTPILTNDDASIFQNIQQELLFIYDLASKYPNSGTLTQLLIKLYGRIKDDDFIILDKVGVLVSIMTEIMCHNPRVYSIGTAIISLLMLSISYEKRIQYAEMVYTKCLNTPNTGIMQLWLQRMYKSLTFEVKKQFPEKLCGIVDKTLCNCELWNMQWISDNNKTRFNEMNFIDQSVIDELTPIYDLSEINPFCYPL